MSITQGHRIQHGKHVARPARTLALVAVTLCGLLVSSPFPRAADTPIRLTAGCPTDIGISPGWNLTEPDADLKKDLQSARNLGAKTFRFDLDWSVVEQVPGVYDWTLTDRMANAVAANGMKPLAVVGFTPEWARMPGTTSSHSAPTDPSAFAAFANRAAGRYAKIITDWEIWNEPNISASWAPTPDPVAYTQLLSLAAAGIRAAQPSANIIAGALSPASDSVPGQVHPLTFTQAIYANGGKNSFNTLSIHPYTFPALPTDPATSWWSTFQQVPLIRNVMVTNGDSSKPIWFTEFGAPTGSSPDSVTPAFQSQCLSDGIKAARKLSYVKKTLIYSLRDAGTDVTDREQNFGLLYNNFTAKPAYATVRSLARPGILFLSC
ncbi:beta-xylosidase [Mycolicibacterium mucogenicum]|uniref:beta-xylosidase n=1 Tax=Mycolicibacterium mucogenicum TaxID=56689 RepID=UPI00226AE19C|nr:beta-xylosidase [Mycolicibacterium mucogenicum]MCX8553825.1 beta-xylosidase [Mycolicibacterium mucogenicum]